MLGSRALAQTMRPAKLNCRTSSQVKLIGVQRGRSTNSSDSSSLRDVRSSTTLITKSRGAAISSRSNAKMTGLQPARPIFETTEPMPRSAFADMRAKCASTRVNDDTCPTAGAAILSRRSTQLLPKDGRYETYTAFLFLVDARHFTPTYNARSCPVAQECATVRAKLAGNGDVPPLHGRQHPCIHSLHVALSHRQSEFPPVHAPATVPCGSKRVVVRSEA